MDLIDINDCENCGILYNKEKVKSSEDSDGNIEYICPLCKEPYIEWSN